MSLSTRKKSSLGNQHGIVQSSNPCSVLSSNPNSEHFEGCCGDRPRDLVRWMLALQKQRYGRTILDEEFTVPQLERNMKLLIKQHEAGKVKQAIKKAVDISRHPFSTKVVRRCI